MLAGVRAKRIAAQQDVFKELLSAEADAKRAAEINALLEKYPQTIRQFEDETASLETHATYLREELARLSQGVSAGNASAMLERAVDASKREVAAAKRNAAAEEGRANLADRAADRASAAELQAHDELQYYKQPPWYRCLYIWKVWIAEPSRQLWVASASLVLGVAGLLLAASYAVRLGWTFCILGVPLLAALLAWSSLNELLAKTQHWGILLALVPAFVFILLVFALFRGYCGLFFFLGAWIGKSLGCIVPTFYGSAWEVAFVRLVFLGFGLLITSTSLPDQAVSLNLVDPIQQMQTSYILSEFYRRAHVCRQPIFFSFTAFCGLMFSSSVVFFIARVSWATAAHSLCWLEFASGLLGNRKAQDELSGLWFVGAFIWMVAVGLRLAYYVQEEMLVDEDDPKASSVAEVGEHNALSRIQGAMDQEQPADVEDQHRRLSADAHESARKECSRLLSEDGAEENAELHEVVALITCVSATLRELKHKLPDV